MLFSKQKNGTPDVEEGPPCTTDDPEIRRRAHELLPPAKLEEVESQLRSYGADDRLTEEEVVSAAAAGKHSYQSVEVSFMVAVVAVSVALAAGLSSLLIPLWPAFVPVLFMGILLFGFWGITLLFRSRVWHVGDAAAVREIITSRREAGTLTIRLTEDPR